MRDPRSDGVTRRYCVASDDDTEAGDCGHSATPFAVRARVALNSLHERQLHGTGRDAAGTARSFTTSNSAAQNSTA